MVDAPIQRLCSASGQKLPASARFRADKLSTCFEWERILARFTDTIKTREEFRAVMGEPNCRVTSKTLSKLDKHCGVFIGRPPFMLIASADANGNTDVSPKGDPIGFVKILDEKIGSCDSRPIGKSKS